MTRPESHLYRKLAAQVEEMIDAGVLQSGDRVPSVRRMSRQQGVSIPTVMQAYVVLENRGQIEARPRSGYYVKARVDQARKSPRVPRTAPLSRTMEAFSPLAALVHDVSDMRLAPLGGANPSKSLLPARKLATIAGMIARRSPELVIDYDPAPGCEKLRHELSRRSLEWGCYLPAEDFVITHGATEALHLALRAVANPGDTVMVESPTYYGLLNLLSFLKLKVMSVPSSAIDGIDPDLAERGLKRQRVAALVLVPNFGNPLGSLVPPENRARLLKLAKTFAVTVIEDDINGDLNHDGPRPQALKALDTEDRVILCGSFSKTLAPGYRTGYVASATHNRKIAQIKTALNFSGCPLPALTVAEFLRNGGYEHHLRRLRQTYAVQVARMRRAILAAFPSETRVSKPSGGFVLWVELPAQVDAMRLFYHARDAGISIAPGHLFAPDDEYGNFIRVSCGHPWNARMAEAVEKLGALVRREMKK